MPGRLCAYPPSSIPFTELQLQHLEALHRVYDLYVWLAFRFEDSYPDRQMIEEWRENVAALIKAGLENLSTQDDDSIG